jgi:hypothetical protein
VKNEQYRPRIIDARIERRLESIGGILITGPKWCGKSTTGMVHANSFINMDIPENRDRYLLASDALLTGDYPFRRTGGMVRKSQVKNKDKDESS